MQHHHSMKPMVAAVRALALVLTVGLTMAAEPHRNLHGAEKRLPPPSRPIEVLQASHLGTDGVDFLACAAALPDGRLVLAGTHLGGGEKQSWGVPWTVLGEAGVMPAYRTVKDKRGRETIRERHPDGTGFLVVLAKDRSRVEEAVRLPWRAGSITAIAVDGDGALYLGGSASERLAAMGKSLDITPRKLVDIHGESAKLDRGYCCKLAPDRRAVAWVRDFWTSEIKPPLREGGAFKATSRPVSLAWDAKSGALRLTAGSRWLLAADGEIKEAKALRGRGARLALRADGTAAWGGDTNTYLGGNGASRGPYRKPYLHVTAPDGTLRFRFFDWSQGMLNSSCWLVADSSTLALHFDREGMLYQAGWSHGGNTPYAKFPQDLRADQPLAARIFPGMSGSPSALYLHRLEPDTGGMLASQCILGVSPRSGLANGAWCDWLDGAHDGSLIVGGKSSAHMMQTPDRLCPEMEPEGPCLWVLDRDLKDLRFASVVPSVYGAFLKGGHEWTSSCVQVDGRNLALIFSAAVPRDEKHDRSAPEVAPLQKGHGGGLTDGWFLALDLGPADTPRPPPAEAQVVPAPREPNPLPKGVKNGTRFGTGTTFCVGSDFPRYPTTLVELRDPKGERWPLFLHGAVAPGGRLVLAEDAPKAGFTVTSGLLATPMGEAHPVLFRDRLKITANGKHSFPPITVTIDGAEGAVGISPGRRSSNLRVTLTGTVSCGEHSAPVRLMANGQIRTQVQVDFIGGSGGIPLSFPGLCASLLMCGTVPADIFPGGGKGDTVHVTVTAYGLEKGLREKICNGELEPVLGTGDRNRQIWAKAKEKWLKKAAGWKVQPPP